MNASISLLTGDAREVATAPPLASAGCAELPLRGRPRAAPLQRDWAAGYRPATARRSSNSGSGRTSCQGQRE